jgi:hypothetical protein
VREDDVGGGEADLEMRLLKKVAGGNSWNGTKSGLTSVTQQTTSLLVR